MAQSDAADEDKVLAELIGQLAPEGGAGARWSARLLPTVPAFAEITVSASVDSTFVLLERALGDLGIDAVSEVSPQGEVRVVGAAGSGLFNMNPTLFDVRVRASESSSASMLLVRCAAKEGLIRQRSAQRLVDRIVAALESRLGAR